MRRFREESSVSGSGVVLIDANADLSQYPPLRDHSLCNNSEITFGDLHSNALKLLYGLIRENILLTTEQAYQTLVVIYYKAMDALTKKDLMIFRQVLQDMRCAALPDGFVLRLIGDELADRGYNDYYMLLVFDKLRQCHVTFEILFSNHGYEFIQVFEQGLKTHFSYLEPLFFARSLTNLRILILRKWITMREVRTLVKTAYLPYIKLLSYTICCATESALPNILSRFYRFITTFSLKIPRRNFILYSHAPIGLETVEALTKDPDLQLNAKPRTVVTLQDKIQQINKRFAEIVISGAITRTFLQQLTLQNVSVCNIPLAAPVLRCIWSRGYNADPPANFTSRYTRHQSFYVHGHDGAGHVPWRYQSFVTNLDNQFGKEPVDAPSEDTGEYAVLYTHRIR